MNPPVIDYHIVLTRNQFEKLLIALGYATGAAFEKADRQLVFSFIELTNTIGSASPDFVPFEIPKPPL